jgi:hypothetical protein
MRPSEASLGECKREWEGVRVCRRECECECECELGTEVVSRVCEEMATSPRSLDPNGCALEDGELLGGVPVVHGPLL